MARILLFLSVALLALPAFARSEPHCPGLPEASGHWQTTRAGDYLLCQVENDEGDVVLKAFLSTHPGNSTYGSNFYRMTQSNGHSYAWFSDRDADGQGRNIARTFLASNNGEFPVLMISFTFNNSEDFVRKADLAARLRVEP